MFCDYCKCDDCRFGTNLIRHAQTKDNSWICDICYWYECCIDIIGKPCDKKDCEHRPELISEWTSWTFSR